MEGNDTTVDASSKLLGASLGAVGDRDVAGASGNESGSDAFAHFASTDHEHTAALQGAQSFGGHLDSRMADAGCGATDAGVGACPLAGFECVAEQQVEGCLGAAFGLGKLPGVAYLTEDFGLAEHGRVEATGHFEEMRNGGLIVLAVEVRVQFVGRQAAEFAEEVAYV